MKCRWDSKARFTVGSCGELHMHPLDAASIPVGRVEVAWRMLTWLGMLRPIAYDLLHIATAIHHVDRVAPRARAEEQNGWQDTPRRIELEVAVTESGQWNSVRSEMEGLLHWMTDDLWELNFTRSGSCPPRQMNLLPEQLPDAAEVALFSGGLDSLAGAHVRLKEQNRPLYLFSSLGTDVRKHFLRQALRPLDRSRYRWIRFEHHLSASPNHSRLETLNRTRGFLFLSAAAALADALGVDCVTTYECGVGALNLPMNEAQVGAQNTHATHPHTLMQLERILVRVLGKELRLDTPFFLHTKGELCRQAGTDLMRLAEASNSCDETERNKRNLNEHCGVCTSCLLRRAALHSVLGDADPTLYRGHATRENGQYQVDAFESQARRFMTMSRYGDLVGCAQTVDSAADYLIERTAPRLSRQEAQDALLSLFQRHAHEVRSFYERQAPRELLHRARQPRSTPRNHDLFSATW